MRAKPSNRMPFDGSAWANLAPVYKWLIVWRFRAMVVTNAWHRSGLRTTAVKIWGADPFIIPAVVVMLVGMAWTEWISPVGRTLSPAVAEQAGPWVALLVVAFFALTPIAFAVVSLRSAWDSVLYQVDRIGIRT